jgi:hypothetical protein
MKVLEVSRNYESRDERVKIYLKSMEQGDTIKLYKQALFRPYNQQQVTMSSIASKRNHHRTSMANYSKKA